MTDGMPERRAALLAGVVKHVGPTYGALDANVLFTAVREEAGLSEEESTLEIMGAVSLLVRLGLLTCNHHDKLNGTIRYGQGTTVTLSRAATSYVWDDDHFQFDAGDMV